MSNLASLQPNLLRRSTLYLSSLCCLQLLMSSQYSLLMKSLNMSSLTSMQLVVSSLSTLVKKSLYMSNLPSLQPNLLMMSLMTSKYSPEEVILSAAP